MTIATSPLVMCLVGCCVLGICIYVAKASYELDKRQKSLATQCLHKRTVHVLMECELGQHALSADLVARLLDTSNCPTKVHVHILESVSSIKAHDLLTPAISKASLLLPRYATYFSDQVHILKVHMSRNLMGPKALQHLLRTLSIQDEIVLFIPPFSSLQNGWDDSIRDQFNADFQNTIFTFPYCQESNASPADWTAYFTEIPKAAQFFVLNSNLELETRDMAKSATVSSFGLSFRHPFAAQHSTMLLLVDALVSYQVQDDLAISLLSQSLGIQLMHGKHLLGCKTSQRRVSNRRANLSAVHKVLETMQESPSMPQELLSYFALYKTEDDDLDIYGRAYLGMSPDETEQEVIIKWGSEEAFETEKEALKYG